MGSSHKYSYSFGRLKVPITVLFGLLFHIIIFLTFCVGFHYGDLKIFAAKTFLVSFPYVETPTDVEKDYLLQVLSVRDYV